MNRAQIESMVETLSTATEGAQVDAANAMRLLANSSKIIKGVRSSIMPMLFAYASGRSFISGWPYRPNPKIEGRGRWDNASHTAEERIDLATPMHPFQLHWKTSDDHVCAASFRNPTGLVVSAPSGAYVQRLRAQLDEFDLSCHDTMKISRRISKHREKE